MPLAPLQAISASTDLLVLINRNLRGDEPALQCLIYSGFAAQAVRACVCSGCSCRIRLSSGYPAPLKTQQLGSPVAGLCSDS